MMAKTKMLLKSFLISYITLIISSSIFTCKCDPITNSTMIDGFTTDLISIDSPDSPLFDPSSTPAQRLANAVARSRLRAKRFNDSLLITSAAAQTTVTVGVDGSYLIKFSIGTPPIPISAIVDTGSHLTWTQCKPCNKCVKQNLPIFDPKTSSTYRTIRCDTYACDAYIPSTECDRRGQKCLYVVHYGDNSYSHGQIAEDVFSFGSTTGRVLRFSKIRFGCGHDNFFHVTGTASGIVGLAGGSASLVRQLGYDKFAYCLMLEGERNKNSKLHFGQDAVVSGRGVVSTPLSPRDTYYYLTLVGITVGNKRIPYRNPFPYAGGNIIIDSGALLTMLPVDFFDEFEVALANQIKARPVRDYLDWRLCYSERIEMPKITVHFKGADVEWSFYNVFIRVGLDYVCMTVDPMQGIPVYGSVAQGNYMVGYDLGRKTVSFKRTECGTF